MGCWYLDPQTLAPTHTQPACEPYRHLASAQPQDLPAPHTPQWGLGDVALTLCSGTVTAVSFLTQSKRSSNGATSQTHCSPKARVLQTQPHLLPPKPMLIPSRPKLGFHVLTWKASRDAPTFSNLCPAPASLYDASITLGQRWREKASPVSGGGVGAKRGHPNGKQSDSAASPPPEHI